MKYILQKKRWLYLVMWMDFIGYRLGWFFKQNNEGFDPEKWKHILIVRWDHIGDVFYTEFFAKAIKRQYPKSRITFLTASWSKPILENNPYIDEVIVHDPGWFAKDRCPQAHPTIFSLISRLRKKKFDAVILSRGDIRENFLAYLAGVPFRIGYGITGGGFLLTHQLVYDWEAHELRRRQSLLQTLGISVGAVEPTVYLSDVEEDAFNAKKMALGLHGNKPWVGIQVSAGSRSKEWPTNRIHDFLKGYLKLDSQSLLIICGTRPDELRLSASNEGKELLEFIKKDRRIINLIGKISLREFMCVAKSCALFLGPDSGPTHIASWLAKETIFLYSGTNVYEHWRPLSPKSIVFRHPVPCSPCSRISCNVDGHPCMREITADEILKSVKPVF